MNTTTQDNNTHYSGYFLLGLLTGSAVGAALAVYFAPRLREELRQRVIDSTADLRSSASEGFQAVATRVASVKDDVTRKGQAARDGVADVVARGAHEVGRGAREVARGAHEVEEFAKASKTA